MKRFFFIAAIAGAALVSCTKNEVAPSVNEQQEISFAAPVISTSTKVTEVANDYDEGLTFSVWAHYYDQTTDGSVYTNFAGGEVFMKEVPVKYDGTIKGWKNATTTYYWPKNGSLTFIAYSPSSVAYYADVDKNGIKFTDYVVGTPANQVDLLFSERAYNKTTVDKATPSGEHPYAGVQINFKHALSSILFKVKAHANYAGTVLTVKKIEVLNAYSTGNFTQGLADQNGATTGQKVTIGGVETQTAAAWSDYATETTYTAYESATGIVLSTNAIYTHNTTATAKTNTTDLILLPQDLKHTATTKDVTIKVTYTLKNGDMTDPIEQVAEVSLVTGNAGGYFTDGTNNISAWEMGKKYTYTIEVGLNEIYFDPRVEAWTPVEVKPNIPIN